MHANRLPINANPSHWPNNPNRPVEQVSWNDLQVFLEILNQKESGNKSANWEYVLPTEAEWEFACRAGTETTYFWGDTISPVNAKRKPKWI